MRQLGFHMKDSTFIAWTQKPLPSRQIIEMMISSVGLLTCFAAGRKSEFLSLPCFLFLVSWQAHTHGLGSPFTSRSCFLLCPLSSQRRWKVSRIQDCSCHLHFPLNSLSHHESNTEKSPLTLKKLLTHLKLLDDLCLAILPYVFFLFVFLF